VNAGFFLLYSVSAIAFICIETMNVNCSKDIGMSSSIFVRTLLKSFYLDLNM